MFHISFYLIELTLILVMFILRVSGWMYQIGSGPIVCPSSNLSGNIIVCICLLCRDVVIHEKTNR